MLSVVILSETRRALRSRWLVLPVVFGAAFSALPMTVAIRDYAEEEAAYVQLVRNAVQSQVQTKHLLGRAVEPGLRVVRPPVIGAALVQGSDRTLPATWDFGPAGAEQGPPYSSTASLVESTTSWDVEELSRQVGCLLGVILGLTSVIGDRSSGWLQARAAIPARPVVWALGRVLGGMAVIALVLVAWWAALDGVLLVLSRRSLRFDLWRLAPIAWIQATTFYAFAVIIGVLIRSPLPAVILAGSLYFFGALLAPSLVSLTVQMLVPVPPRAAMERERRTVHDESMLSAEAAFGPRLAAALPSGLQEHDIEAAADRVYPQLDGSWQLEMANTRALIDRLEASWRGRLETQQRLARAVTWLIPGALGRLAAAEAVGTGPSTVASWNHAVSIHARKLQLALFDNRPRVNLRADVGAGSYAFAFDRRTPWPTLQQMPAFERPKESRRVYGPVMGLALWLTVACAGACLCEAWLLP